jgi:hypothetical protein
MKKTLTALAFITACAPAHAQQYGALNIIFCSPTQQLMETLEMRFNRVAVFEAIHSPIHLDQIFLNVESGEYSYVRTNIEDNISCVLTDGFSGQIVRPRIIENSL